MPSAVLRVLIPAAFVVLSLAASSAEPEICLNDVLHVNSATFAQTGNCRAEMRGYLELQHNHPGHSGCVGILSTHLSMTTAQCELVRPASHPISATSNAYHKVTSTKVCSSIGTGNHQAEITHLFNNRSISPPSTNHRLAATVACSGGNTCNPCFPGYIQDCSQGGRLDPCGCCLDPTPILIDRSGDGVTMSSPDEGALFDINGLNDVLWLGWPLTSDDAWLALDRNGNDAVDDGSELFGNTRNLASGINAKHGYEVLAELDENADGSIDAADPLFSKLLLWADANRNGISEPKELVPLRSAGMTALALSFESIDLEDKWGNRFLYKAPVKALRSGKEMPWSIDVFPAWLVPDSIPADETSRRSTPRKP